MQYKALMNLKGRPASLPSNAWHAAARDVALRRELMALSKGRLEGGGVICSFHELVFNSWCNCIHYPSQEALNSSACVAVFPVAETPFEVTRTEKTAAGL